MEDLVGSTIKTSPAPKSILKKSSQRPAPAVPPNVNVPAPTTDQQARHLQTALTYANQIQAQKALQLEILGHIETLSLLPSASPVPVTDVQAFKSGVALFQPSDYTALLEERTVNGFCGYTLCANPPPPVRKGREWLRPEAERRFCSIGCARKAMYVRAQLDETPAWERRGGLGDEIRLKDEDETKGEQTSMPIRLREQKAETEESQLAHERGEKPQSRKVKLVTDDVVEKETAKPTPGKVEFKLEDLAHENIEGYSIPSGKYRTTKVQSAGDGD
ncbi:hypothetical protein K461DRAFT_294861 [Myriangium duriaei CBS 260.36]|uniref:RNA polymerase II subunit B1 CTD phosphatase RPAP2 homolog n=1 Tax=Myriangium duriaei CBS 260.36 TaxID=1168546 RepID=A0A9P4IY31_9PEZI|nr:hypothetical protein K461DRAFT_294861 [Myriangium duriaei CBS 260.36]